MDTDFDDDFDQEESTVYVSRSRPGAIIPDGDDFPDEPAGHSPAGASGEKNAGALTNSPVDVDDEFPDEPRPVGPVNELADDSDTDPHWLFPEGWDTQKSTASPPERKHSKTKPRNQIPQTLLESYHQLNNEISELKKRQKQARCELLELIRTGADVEAGIFKLIHREQERFHFTEAGIVATFGNDGLEKLKRVVGTRHVDWVQVKRAGDDEDENS